MTTKRDLKALVRERMAKTGESYQTALRALQSAKESPVLNVGNLPPAEALAFAERVCDTQYGECVLPKGHLIEGHGDDHQTADGTWWNIGQEMGLTAREQSRVEAAMLLSAEQEGRLIVCTFCKVTFDSVESLQEHVATCSEHPAVKQVAQLLGNTPAGFPSPFPFVRWSKEKEFFEGREEEFGFNVKRNAFERELLAEAKALLKKPVVLEDGTVQAGLPEGPRGPLPTEMRHSPYPSFLELADEARALVEAEARGPRCTCGPDIEKNYSCPFHRPPIIEVVPRGEPERAVTRVTPDDTDERIDVVRNVAEKFRKRAEETVVHVDVGNLSPNAAARVVAGVRFATCTACNHVYELFETKSRQCAQCMNTPVEVLPVHCDECGEGRNLSVTDEGTYVTCVACGHVWDVDLNKPPNFRANWCSVRSSITNTPCTLVAGHPAYRPDRFHRFA